MELHFGELLAYFSAHRAKHLHPIYIRYIFDINMIVGQYFPIDRPISSSIMHNRAYRPIYYTRALRWFRVSRGFPWYRWYSSLFSGLPVVYFCLSSIYTHVCVYVTSFSLFTLLYIGKKRKTRHGEREERSFGKPPWLVRLPLANWLSPFHPDQAHLLFHVLIHRSNSSKFCSILAQFHVIIFKKKIIFAIRSNP